MVAANPIQDATHITVENVTMAYGDFVVQQGLDFAIKRSDIFIIMGDSGCGKARCSGS